MQPDVSIIIVSWNTRTCLEKCLGARDPATQGLATEVIVVDDGSRDGSQAMVSAQYPTARLIQNQGDLGYGRACNIGVLAGRGDSVHGVV